MFGALPKRVFFFISGSSQKWNYLQLGEEYASCQWQANIEKERKQEGLFFFVLDWISGKKTGMGEKTKNAASCNWFGHHPTNVAQVKNNPL